MQKGGDACGEATQPPRLQESPGAVVGGRPLPPPPAPALHPAHHHRPRHPRRLRGQGTFIRTNGLRLSFRASPLRHGLALKETLVPIPVGAIWITFSLFKRVESHTLLRGLFKKHQ